MHSKPQHLFWWKLQFFQMYNNHNCAKTSRNMPIAHSIWNTTGVVSSPNFPGNYPANIERKETIKVEQGLLLLLQFTAFDIQFTDEFLTTCSDHLTIMDEDGTTLMEKSCGSHFNGSILFGDKMIGSFLPVPIRSRSNIVNLTFSSDSSINTWPGWSLSWTAVTSGVSMCSTATAHIYM